MLVCIWLRIAVIVQAAHMVTDPKPALLCPRFYSFSSSSHTSLLTCHHPSSHSVYRLLLFSRPLHPYVTLWHPVPLLLLSSPPSDTAPLVPLPPPTPRTPATCRLSSFFSKTSSRGFYHIFSTTSHRVGLCAAPPE